MKLKNYQEDLVLHTIDIVLSERKDVEQDEDFINDVAAYTLNRLPPRYIMSERGFFRYAREFLIDEKTEADDKTLAEYINIFMLVNRAVDIINSRRKNDHPDNMEKASCIDDEILELTYWHNFPHIIGRILDIDNKSAVDNVSVTLLINGEKAEAADCGWSNPYKVTSATKGYYSFWPRPIRNSKEKLDSPIEISINHGNYESLTISDKIVTTGEFERAQSIHPEYIRHIETAFLKRKVS